MNNNYCYDYKVKLKHVPDYLNQYKNCKIEQNMMYFFKPSININILIFTMLMKTPLYIIFVDYSIAQKQFIVWFL